jgi:BNR/Asp-box repeat
MTTVRVLVGTKKGVFILESDAGRGAWEKRGPFCEHWPVQHVVGDAATGAIYAAAGSEWFGPAIWTSRDFGASWTHSSQGLKYAEGEAPVKNAWSVAVGHGRIYAGVEPAGLFVSDDSGATFRQLDGLTRHPTRSEWQPGGAGLILHSIVVDPDDPNQMWVGISSVGVFHTADGGATWTTRNKGTRADYMPEGMRYPEFGQCVHCIARAPGKSGRLYQQNHCGMYRSDDGGQSWQSIEAGLPSSFGFPVAVHPRDPDKLFFAPLNGAELGRYPPDAKAAVWRSDDGGAHWADKREGLPQEGAYFGVMRQAMATDALEPAGVYLGASNGSIFASRDEGESFVRIVSDLPAISSIETLVSA